MKFLSTIKTKRLTIISLINKGTNLFVCLLVCQNLGTTLQRSLDKPGIKHFEQNNYQIKTEEYENTITDCSEAANAQVKINLINNINVIGKV